jgi:hypothetical protein
MAASEFGFVRPIFLERASRAARANRLAAAAIQELFFEHMAALL